MLFLVQMRMSPANCLANVGLRVPRSSGPAYNPCPDQAERPAPLRHCPAVVRMSELAVTPKHSSDALYSLPSTNVCERTAYLGGGDRVRQIDMSLNEIAYNKLSLDG